ncbi:MAG: hypothetical protein GY943_39375, partial [Chloroflexi bacterium]|nr:hypothetical protein [Chloroflexota bacterium]
MKNQKQKTKTTWQTAVQQKMKDATEQEAKKRYGTKSPAFNYRWEHVTAVVTTAIKL